MPSPSFPRRTAIAVLVTLLLAVLLAPSPATARDRPDVIDLPIGFQPEGIASAGRHLFVGSIPTGDIYRANRNTGEGEVLVDAPDGRLAIGLEVDRRRGWLWVAGGPTGAVYIYDLRTGAEIAELSMPVPPDAAATFINDVHVTRRAAYVTDSQNAVFYRVPIRRAGGLGQVEAIDLTGDWEQVEGFNANGIVGTPGNRDLLIINSTTGVLYRVDRRTGEARSIEIEGAPNGAGTLPAGDGLFRRGKTVWVVQNRFNQVIEIELEKRGTAAEVEEILTNPALDIPTTVTRSGGDLYVVNARFGIENPAEAGYEIVRLDD